MRSAFGVEHGEEISKLGFSSVKNAFSAAKTGFGAGQKGSAGATAMGNQTNKFFKAGAKTGSHLKRNENAYKPAALVGGGAAGGSLSGYYAGQRRS